MMNSAMVSGDGDGVERTNCGVAVRDVMVLSVSGVRWGG